MSRIATVARGFVRTSSVPGRKRKQETRTEGSTSDEHQEQGQPVAELLWLAWHGGAGGGGGRGHVPSGDRQGDDGYIRCGWFSPGGSSRACAGEGYDGRHLLACPPCPHPLTRKPPAVALASRLEGRRGHPPKENHHHDGWRHRAGPRRRVPADVVRRSPRRGQAPARWKPMARVGRCAFTGYEATDTGLARSLPGLAATGAPSKAGRCPPASTSWRDVQMDMRCDNPDCRSAHTFTVQKAVLWTFDRPRPRGMDASHLYGNPLHNWWPKVSRGRASQPTRPARSTAPRPPTHQSVQERRSRVREQGPERGAPMRCRADAGPVHRHDAPRWRTAAGGRGEVRVHELCRGRSSSRSSTAPTRGPWPRPWAAQGREGLAQGCRQAPEGGRRVTTQNATTQSERSDVTDRDTGPRWPSAPITGPVTESDSRDSRNRPNFSAPSARSSGGRGAVPLGGIGGSLIVTTGPGQISDSA